MAKEVQVIKGRMRSTFSEEEKARIAKESYASPLSLNKFARDTGISPATLCTWRKHFKSSSDCTQEENESRDNSGGSASNSMQVATLDGLAQDYDRLKTENQSLKSQVVQLKAFIGHKIFEFEASRYV